MMAKKFLAPDIGALFTWKGERYRVTAYKKPIPPERVPPDEKELCEMSLSTSGFMSGFLTRVMYEARDGDYLWCSRQEATHVSGYGLLGCIAPIEEITVTGNVSDCWSEEAMKSSQRHAEWLVTQNDF
jgi:hypothetical protein